MVTWPSDVYVVLSHAKELLPEDPFAAIQASPLFIKQNLTLKVDDGW